MTTTAETMEAGRELDALVAERVFGYVWKRSAWTTGSPARHSRVLIRPEVAAQYGDSDLRGDESDARAVERVPRYSTDIAAAWLVVEAMRKRGLHASIGGPGFDPVLGDGVATWAVWFYPEGWAMLDGDHAHADTAPLAICRAALAAVGAAV